MSPKQPERQPKPARDERLAKALRDNLRRRKAARSTPAGPPASGDAPQSEADKPDASAQAPAAPPPFWRIRTIDICDRDTGASSSVALEMTAPFAHPQGGWACGIRLDGLEGAQPGCFVHGADGVQALQRAQSRIQSELLRVQETHDLTCQGQPYAPSPHAIWRSLSRG